MTAKVRHETGQLTTVHAINAFYVPVVATTDIINTPDAPAAWTTLDQATRGTEQLAFMPWAQPALCFDGLSTADVQTRRFALSVGPALIRARWRSYAAQRQRARCNPRRPSPRHQQAQCQRHPPRCSSRWRQRRSAPMATTTWAAATLPPR
jgi:hypothetical protein